MRQRIVGIRQNAAAHFGYFEVNIGGLAAQRLIRIIVGEGKLLVQLVARTHADDKRGQARNTHAIFLHHKRSAGVVAKGFLAVNYANNSALSHIAQLRLALHRLYDGVVLAHRHQLRFNLLVGNGHFREGQAHRFVILQIHLRLQRNFEDQLERLALHILDCAKRIWLNLGLVQRLGVDLVGNSVG